MGSLSCTSNTGYHGMCKHRKLRSQSVIYTSMLTEQNILKWWIPSKLSEVHTQVTHICIVSLWASKLLSSSEIMIIIRLHDGRCYSINNITAELNLPIEHMQCLYKIDHLLFLAWAGLSPLSGSKSYELLASLTQGQGSLLHFCVCIGYTLRCSSTWFTLPRAAGPRWCI